MLGESMELVEDCLRGRVVWGGDMKADLAGVGGDRVRHFSRRHGIALRELCERVALISGNGVAHSPGHRALN